MSLCLSRVRADFSFPTTFWVSQIDSPLVFKVRLLGVSSLQCRSQSEECLIQAWTPTPPERSFMSVRCLLTVVMPGVGCLVKLSLLSCISPCGPFFLCCGGAVHLVFRSFFSENCSLLCVDLVCPWTKVSAGSPALPS